MYISDCICDCSPPLSGTGQLPQHCDEYCRRRHCSLFTVQSTSASCRHQSYALWKFRLICIAKLYKSNMTFGFLCLELYSKTRLCIFVPAPSLQCLCCSLCPSLVTVAAVLPLALCCSLLLSTPAPSRPIEHVTFLLLDLYVGLLYSVVWFIFIAFLNI